MFVHGNEEMKILSIEDIAAAEDVREGPFFVKEWNGHVIIRGITQRDMREIRRSCLLSDGEVDQDKLEKMIFIKGMVKPQVHEGNFEMFLEKSSNAYMSIVNEITGQSGQTEEAMVAAEKRFPD